MLTNQKVPCTRVSAFADDEFKANDVQHLLGEKWFALTLDEHFSDGLCQSTLRLTHCRKMELSDSVYALQWVSVGTSTLMRHFIKWPFLSAQERSSEFRHSVRLIKRPLDLILPIRCHPQSLWVDRQSSSQ